MTRKETLGIMAILKANYPMYYKNKDKQDLQAVVNLWHEMFVDDSADLVVRAVKMFIATDDRGFPPVIGQIKKRLIELLNPNEMTEQEAWNIVKKAVMRSGWHAEEEFEKLPPVIKKIVGSATQLKEWGLMETDNFDTVIGSNFMRSYKVKAKSEKEYQALPSDIQSLISGVSDKLMIEDKEDEG